MGKWPYCIWTVIGRGSRKEIGAEKGRRGRRKEEREEELERRLFIERMSMRRFRMWGGDDVKEGVLERVEY